MPRLTTQVSINRILDDDTLLKAVAKQAAESPAVRGQLAAKASAVATAAKTNLGAAGEVGWRGREREQVADAIKVVVANSKWTRASVYAGTQTTVFLVTAPHPASSRWEFGTSRIPMSGFMRAALKANGGK